MKGPHRLDKLRCILALMVSAWPGVAYAQLIKSPLSGFVSMGTVGLGPGEKPNNSLKFILAEPGVFSGVVINISWTQLEPAPNSFDTSGIDQALQAVAAYNAAYPAAPLGIRLNVEAGLLAPGWAKNLNGPPIEITDIPNGASPPIIFTIGRFWESAYSNDWRQLQNMLATKYDGNPLIHEVTNGSCATVTDEPFVLVTTPFAIANMHSAGFTDQEYYNCLASSPADYVAWKESLIHYTFNPFLRTDSGISVTDEATTVALIRKWRAALGLRAVLANHDLISGPGTTEFPNIVSIYATFQQLGPLIDLQAWSATQDWQSTIAYGIASGATDIELWPGFAAGEAQAMIPKSYLEAWSAELKARVAETNEFLKCGPDTCPN